MKNISINVREMYLKLGLEKTQYSRWTRGNIVLNDCFKECVHWTSSERLLFGNKTIDYLISKEFALHLINSAKTISSKIKIDTLKYYDIYEKSDVVSRPEREFYDDLETFLRVLGVPVEKQFKILNYRIDFLVNGYIAVEFDERHHENITYLDLERTKNIDEYVYKLYDGNHKLEWVRVKQGEVIKGLAEISKLLIKTADETTFDGKVSVFTSEDFNGYFKLES